MATDRATDFVIGGIEGGATKSNIVLLNAEGNVIAHAKGPGTNHYNLGKEECERRLAAMVSEVKKAAGIPEATQLTALGLSLSGCEKEETNNEIVAELKEKYPNLSNLYAIGSDTEGSVATTSNEGGITCISGTGSNTLLINSDGSRTGCGGWGHMLGDEGSGYHISRTAVKICIDATDGFRTTPHSIDTVWEIIKKHFKIQTVPDLLDIFYTNFNKAHIASLCTQLAALAQKGDALSKMLFDDAGRDLAKAISVVARKASPQLKNKQGGLHVLCVGSVWLGWDLLKPGFLKYLDDNTDIKELSLMQRTTEMAVGAAYMAADKLNLTLKRHYSDNYSVFYRYSKAIAS